MSLELSMNILMKYSVLSALQLASAEQVSAMYQKRPFDSGENKLFHPDEISH